MVTRRRTLGLLGAAPLLAERASWAQEGAPAAGPIDRQTFISIGGVEQWISVRGASADNPVLLFLHGGPGEAQSPFLDRFAPWEETFTVAHWDQRGAGKTFGRNPSPLEDMTFGQLASDAIAIAEYLRLDLGQEKIVLVGHSWGSMAGWRAALERPDLFHAFVGTGMSVSWAQAVTWQETWVRAQGDAEVGAAAPLSNPAGAQTLPVDNITRAGPMRDWILTDADLAYLQTQRAFLGAEPYPEGDVADWAGGVAFCATALTAEAVAYDAYSSSLEVGTPVFVIQGRDDLVTPAALAEQFVEDVRAPRKRYVGIRGGHFACYTNVEGFALALDQHVRPLTR